MASDDSSVSSTKYDLVVFGATGFTGQYVVEEIARTIDDESGLTWAIAGRDMKKLQDVLASAGKQTGKNLEDLPILIADVKTEQSLLEMCEKARVVLNCVGPYNQFGPQVVRACVEKGCSHIDISGEPLFLEKMQLLYHSKAAEKGVYIVGSCGFDSVPCDMGVLFMQEKFDGEVNSVEGFIGIKPGPDGARIHYGTWASAIDGFGVVKETITQRKQLYAEKLPTPKHRMPKRGAVWKSEELGSWCIPFQGSDRSVVNRTQRFLHDEKKQRAVQFNAFFRMPSLMATVLMSFFGVIFAGLASFGLGRSILKAFPGLFSCGMVSHAGPSRKQMETTSFSYTFVARGYDKKLSDPDEQPEEEPKKKLTTKILGPEPGYVATPICMVQCAYSLLKEAAKLPKGGGVFTPGAAFADTSLIERLEKNNVKFTVVE